MENDVLLSLIEILPYKSKCRIQHLVLDLINEAREANVIKDEEFEKYQFTITDDFNEPIKYFHEYMYNMDIEFINKIEKLPLKKQMELESITDEMLAGISKP